MAYSQSHECSMQKPGGDIMTLKQIEERIEKIKREKEIHCPHCGAEYHIDADDYEIFSTHGFQDHGNYFELTCQECEKDFVGKELVRRTWETFKTAEELRKIF